MFRSFGFSEMTQRWNLVNCWDSPRLLRSLMCLWVCRQTSVCVRVSCGACWANGSMKTCGHRWGTGRVSPPCVSADVWSAICTVWTWHRTHCRCIFLTWYGHFVRVPSCCPAGRSPYHTRGTDVVSRPSGSARERLNPGESKSPSHSWRICTVSPRCDSSCVV